MTKPIYVHLKLSGQTDLGRTYPDHIIYDTLSIAGHYVTSKYLLVSHYLGYGGAGWEYYDYEISIDSESETKPTGLLPGDANGEKLYYSDPDYGQKYIWAWHTVYVEDSYVIPPGLDQTGLFGQFRYDAATHTSITWNGYSLNAALYASTHGGSLSDVVSAAVSSLPTLAGYALSALGFPNLATPLQNIQVVQNSLLTTTQAGINFIGLLGSGASDQQLDAAAASTFNTIVNTWQSDAFRSAVLVPGNPGADTAAHAVLSSIGFGGTSTGLTLGTAQVGFQLLIPGGLTITTDATATIGYIVGPATGNYELLGNSRTNYLIGGGGNDSLWTGGNHNYLNGGAGNDTIHVNNATNYVQGGSGDDTVVMLGSIQSYSSRLGTTGSAIIIGGSGTFAETLVGVEHVRFTDGTVDVSTSTPLIDPFWYDSANRDVLASGIAPSTHYDQFGWKEGRDPNAYFSTSGYLITNSDVKAANIDPLQHYDTSGWKEGRDPSASFDTSLYLLHNPDVAAAHIDPLAHYLSYGAAEGRQAYAAIGASILADGFDAEYYLLANPDVAASAGRSGVNPDQFAFQHYTSYGWREGRNPNAWFDDKGYIAHYGTLMAPGLSALDDYNQFGWMAGRDPSAQFSTSNYFFQNADVASAGINPLVHYLQHGAYENRSPPFSISPWAVSGTPLQVGGTVGGSIDGATDVDTIYVLLNSGHRYVFSFDNKFPSAIDYANINVTNNFAGSEYHYATAKTYGINYLVPVPHINTFGFTPQNTGEYAVKISNAEADAGGAYGLSVSDITATAANISRTESTDFGGTLATALSLGTAEKTTHAFSINGALGIGDHDMFQFTSQGGQIDIHYSNVSSPIFLAMSYQNNFPLYYNLPVANATSGDLMVDLTPGTYYVDVSTNNNVSTPYHIDIFA